ncbi:MAG: MCP four helix bundle domain-containing protein, partial [Thermodesulfobacterium sp.]|nr:MCP four helix bundle domain-containing protein [Thermodesulfobacterium sp.]MDW8136791.1 MCP four helix bundle domain-containing protein [Thermodesulfobacterium sp.]
MFKNLSISKKLFLSFGFFIFIFIILFALSLYFMRHTNTFLDYLDERVNKKLNNAVSIRRSILVDIQMAILEMLVTKDPKIVEENRKRITQARENYFKALEEIKKVTRTEEGMKKLKNLEEAIADLRGYNNKVLELISAGRWEEAIKVYYTECLPRVTKMEKALDEEVAFQQKRFRDEMKVIESTLLKQQIVITVFSILAVILGLIFGIGISRSITKPTNYLVGSLKRVGEGDLGVELNVDRRDEVGKMMLALREALEGMK